MKKTFWLWLVVLVAGLCINLYAYAQPTIEVSLNKESGQVSVSGSFDGEYTNTLAGLYVIAQDSDLPSFDDEGSSDVFISIQDTITDDRGNFVFGSINAQDIEGNILFNVVALSDFGYSHLSKTIYIPTKEAVDNFFEFLGMATCGDDVYTLINADFTKTEIDGKNVQVGLDSAVYEAYPEVNMADVAELIYKELKDGNVSTVTEFDALHTEKVLLCAFLMSDTPEDVWSFINADNSNEYCNQIAVAIDADKLKNLSVVKELSDYDEELQQEIINDMGVCADLAQWKDALSVNIINRELDDATNSYVVKVTEKYADVLETFDFDKYDELEGYHSKIGGEILKKAPFETVKDYCEAANAAMKKIEKNKDSSSSGSSSLGGGSKRPSSSGGGFTAQVTPVVVPEVIVPPVDTKDETSIFSDIESVSWAKEAIESLCSEKILSGKSEGLFYPNDNITREEFVKILVLSMGKYDSSAKCDFEDVSENDWHYTYVASAVNAGIVKGISNTVFGAGSYISRQDVATMLYRALEDKNSSGDVSVFADADKIAPYAQEAVAFFAKEGIINGMPDGTFCPVKFCTRAQAAKIIYETLRRQ